MSSEVLGVLGLGYVGLPLAVAFAQTHRVVGFDLNADRIQALRTGIDGTEEVSADELAGARGLELTTEVRDLASCTRFIVTVPTPVTASNKPDLGPLLRATETVGSVLKKGDIVIYESTVYPGCTEEDCVPLLERTSGLRFNEDFFCGYSPERINPGDREHRFTTIRKVTSGSNPWAAEAVDALYRSVVTAGTYRASSIRVAEAAKVIENAQRDINIAFVNELSKIFHLMGIDTSEVLAAAGTKWNFLPFQPGLVGGHCIGVDPYYLTHKAEQLGYHPEVILAGRRINDGMGRYVAQQTVKLMGRRGFKVTGERVLVLGLTFKENCRDTRNTRVVDLIRELEEFGCLAEVCDPLADPATVAQEYGLSLLSQPPAGSYAAVILAVPHRAFSDPIWDPRRFLVPNGVVYDVKAALGAGQAEGRL